MTVLSHFCLKTMMSSNKSQTTSIYCSLSYKWFEKCPGQKIDQKDQIILATGRGILADFGVPHEIES